MVKTTSIDSLGGLHDDVPIQCVACGRKQTSLGAILALKAVAQARALEVTRWRGEAWAWRWFTLGFVIARIVWWVIT